MLEELNQSLQFINQSTQQNFQMLTYILLVFWFSFILSKLFPPLLLLGLRPRRLTGLPGILFSPFLHADFNHLFFNSIPLLVLSNFILLHGIEYYLWLSLLIILIGGFALWCFGQPGLHIGASGLITGYWGFLVSNAYYQLNVTTVILALISIYYFAGIFLGIFPSKKGVSWDGHLFGFLAGLAVSFYIGNAA